VEDGSYQPLSRPIFIYVSKKSLDGKPEVKEFVDFYLQNAPQLVKQVKYVALPGNAYTIGADHVKKGKVGTVFGGTAEVGVKIEDLLKREASL
jgi:phosphate transport system substrate-binding protein